MKISVRVKVNAKEKKIEKIGECEFVVWVKAQAKEGKANKALIGILSEYFGVAKTRVVILQGEKNKNKLIAIE